MNETNEGNCCFLGCQRKAEWELLGLHTTVLDHTESCTEHVSDLLQLATREYRLTRLCESGNVGLLNTMKAIVEAGVEHPNLMHTLARNAIDETEPVPTV